MRSPASPALARAACAILLLADLASRLQLAAALSLSKDELCYWYWSRDLDASFALLPFASIRLACGALGDTALAVRLPFVLAASGAAVFLAAFTGALRLHPWVAAAAVALFAGTAWLHYVGSLAHPDAFLALFWMAALWALARSARAASRREGAWILAGAVLAGAAALSKYTGFLLWPAWLLASLAAGRGRRPAWPWLLAGTVVWLAAVSPALLAIAGEGAHWARATFHLSDLSRHIPAGARIPALFAAPALALFTPGYVVYAVGLLHALARRRQPTSVWGWTGVVAALPVLTAAARGSIKGNWILPSFWGTLPRGAAFFLAGDVRRAVLILLVAAGIASTAAMHLALLDPDRASEIGARLPYSDALDQSYESTVSTQELRHAATRTWRERAYEFHVSRGAVDSVAARAAAFDSSAAVVTNLYEIAYAARFYRSAKTVHLVEDTRFSRTDLFLADDGFWPETAIYVTVPGGRLPEPFFLRYGYLEREEDLMVPVGRLGGRTYDVWRCAGEAR
jgi:4-amino-4-deoxy-L-arabinose transferase-like glycosyltransferase